MLACRGKGCAWTDKGAGRASEWGLCSFAPAQNVAKWGLGGSLGFAGAGCTTRSKGQRLLQLGQGVKQPWSCWAGEGQALEHQGLRTVTPCVLFIPVSVDTGLQPCNVTTACRLNTPRLILVPWSYPPCPDKGQLLCRIGLAKTLPLAVMIWGLWHSQGLRGVRYCLKSSSWWPCGLWEPGMWLLPTASHGAVLSVQESVRGDCVAVPAVPWHRGHPAACGNKHSWLVYRRLPLRGNNSVYRQMRSCLATCPPLHPSGL